MKEARFDSIRKSYASLKTRGAKCLILVSFKVIFQVAFTWDVGAEKAIENGGCFVDLYCLGV